MDILAWKLHEEHDSCRCHTCKALVQEVFDQWNQGPNRALALNMFLRHTAICYKHKYQAHQ